MYAFDGYLTPIRNIVFGTCFPSIALSNFYSVRIRTYVHNLYTAGKPVLRPIQQWYFYLGEQGQQVAETIPEVFLMNLWGAGPTSGKYDS